MNEWLPIESAPRDGTAFLAYCPGKSGYFARQDVQVLNWTGWGGGAWETLSGGKYGLHEPTHWMPLPTPPPRQSSASDRSQE